MRAAGIHVCDSPAELARKLAGSAPKCLDVTVDTAARRSGIHACPAGRVMVALDLAGGRIFCGRRIERCYGALGQRCGIQGEGLTTPLALCANGACLINAGSWEHDECCWRFPNGDTCRAMGASTDGHCVTEFGKAVGRLTGGYNWKRNVNFATINANGTVVANTFCAPNGTFVHKNEPNRCCSGNRRLMKDAFADPLGAADDLAKATLQGVNPVEIGSGNPKQLPLFALWANSSTRIGKRGRRSIRG